MTATTDRETWNPTEVAADLDLPRISVIRKLRRKEIGGGFQVGRQWRVDVEQYRAWKRSLTDAVVDPHSFSPRSARSEAALNRRKSS